MLRALQHRGPDDIGYWHGANCSLGHTRLAVIDLSPAARQPLTNERESLKLVFNGEIYNFQSLKRELESLGHRFATHTDGETIVHAYEEWGAACVDRLRGMFAFAIWDEDARELFLARDRVGKKPLFFAALRGVFLFASEMQAILAHPGVPRDIDEEAINGYLSWGYVPAPWSGLRAVRKVLPGHRMIVSAKGQDWSIKSERYWTLNYRPKFGGSFAEGCAALRERVIEAVKLRLVSDVPVGAFLSGGIDSSLIVGLMARETGRRVHTFSIGFDNDSYDERPFARHIARRWETEHHEDVLSADALSCLPDIVRHYGEPYADVSAIPTWYVAKYARQYVTVALNGDGGDESFAGYPRFQFHKYVDWLRRVPGTTMVGAALAKRLRPSRSATIEWRIRRCATSVVEPLSRRHARWLGMFRDDEKRQICEPSFLDRVVDSAGMSWMSASFDRRTGLDAVDAAMAAEVETKLPYDLLVKVDIACMASGLEPRSPLLDQSVMELAAQFPVGWKLRGRRAKRILTEAFAEVLPQAIVQRKKTGFGVPIGQWLVAPGGQWLRDVFLDDRARFREFLRPREVKRLWTEHERRVVDHGQQLWTIAMLELWLRGLDESTANITQTGYASGLRSVS
jgi:asparagine synthase (glutamine-hydrolysing)